MGGGDEEGGRLTQEQVPNSQYNLSGGGGMERGSEEGRGSKEQVKRLTLGGKIAK